MFLNIKKSKNAFLYAMFLFTLCMYSLSILSCFYSQDRNEDSLMAILPTQSATIILDAGHGGEDCGAIGKNGVYEKELNLLIATELGRQLSDLGYNVVHTRTEDRLLYSAEENIKGLRKIYDLKNRAKIAESYDDAIFISIHMNSFSDEKYSGLQVFFSQNHAQSQVLARAIQTQVQEKLQPNNHRNIKAGSGLYLMENLCCPAILIECGFLSNTNECEKLCEKEYQKQLCFSILCGIISSLEE